MLTAPSQPHHRPEADCRSELQCLQREGVLPHPALIDVPALRPTHRLHRARDDVSRPYRRPLVPGYLLVGESAMVW